MLAITSLADIAALRENFEVECKLAAGRDGNGELPRDFWATYSAFANSDGGDVLLGVEERKGRFRLNGIANTTKVLDDLWNQVNNSQKVSANILRPAQVRELYIDGQTIIQIHVPRAARTQRPVFINDNPMTGTYRRQNSGDYRCDGETVRRMLAEQVEDSRDTEILQGYGLEDLDFESFNAYRQRYASRQPAHPWNELEPQAFLKSIGGWRRDRESNRFGLTRAGLLMFGQLPSIQESFPNYMLDFQERPQADVESRWVDRLTLDGAWSGNLFDFYRRVIKKLTSELKVPFALEGDMRLDDTPVLQALREALINTLVHADYSGRASVLVVKRPDMFGFRNPGLMRIPQELAIQGGDSDCRNRLIHQMFRYVGLGEQAGSGIPKIYRGWDSHHWRAPLLYEKHQPSEQTLLELRMLDLLPPSAIEHLQALFGKKFDGLDRLQRLILATAKTEQIVSHRRMAEITTEHAHDLTLAFQALAKNGFLVTTGHGRGTVYCLPGQNFPTPDQAFGQGVLTSRPTPASVPGGSGPTGGNSGHLEVSSGHLTGNSGHSDRDKVGRLLVDGLSKPLIDDLDLLDRQLALELSIEADDAKQKGKLPREELIEIILSLCNEDYLTLPVLCQLLDRKPDPLRKNYLKPLVDEGRLALAFPTKPTHPQQAYTTTGPDGQ
ncbi:MAG: putative DNA binding domain-containing protein [Candidatus Thiodiazotropha sp. (ex Dulcina madagascariensis)]|nr:putative DNA binding domain-containing protein [Candidatus Thiodiazotropha sp. (ex Dulcina madagascariensis)]